MRDKLYISVLLALAAGIILPKPCFADKTLRQIEEIDKLTNPVVVQPIKRPSLFYSSDNLRDPFQENIRDEEENSFRPTSNEVQQRPPDLAIQGIIWGGKIPQAIINNSVVKAGDTISGARILEITKNGVTVFYNNTNFDLSSPAADNLKSLDDKSRGGQNEVKY